MRDSRTYPGILVVGFVTFLAIVLVVLIHGPTRSEDQYPPAASLIGKSYFLNFPQEHSFLQTSPLSDPTVFSGLCVDDSATVVTAIGVSRVNSEGIEYLRVRFKNPDEPSGWVKLYRDPTMSGKFVPPCLKEYEDEMPVHAFLSRLHDK